MEFHEMHSEAITNYVQLDYDIVMLLQSNNASSHMSAESRNVAISAITGPI